MRFRFLRSILIVTALAALALAYPLVAWWSAEVSRAVIGAGVIAFVNVMIGCFLLEYSLDKSNSIFMIAVFGGMVVRMMLIMAVLAILLLNGYHALTLALALMGFYVAYMVAEIYYVLKELNKRPAGGARRRPAESKPLMYRAPSLNN